MFQSLIACVLKLIKAFPSKNEISITMIPSIIVEGKVNPNFNHKRITFGSYAMVYTGTTTDMKIRSVPAIALNESNDHRGHYFMNIYTGKLLQSYQWTELPIYDDVISQVRDLDEVEYSKEMTDNYPVFEWEPGILVADNVSEEDTPIKEET